MVLLRHKKRVLLGMLFFVSLVFLGAYQLATTPLIPKQGAPVVISLGPAESALQFVKTLKEKQLIRFTKPMLLLIRLKGTSAKLKAGVYEVNPGDTAVQLLTKVVAGEVLSKNFTIIAGTTQKKVSQDLQHAAYLIYNPIDWTGIQSAHLNAEGLLLADTYQYRGGSSSKTLLEQAHRNLINFLNQCWANRVPNLPFKNPYELLTAASIIEKETAIASERKLIAGVLVNRLNKKMPLQMDPTVIYGLGAAYNGKLVHKDLQIDSPYNSYKYRGLPPTPIAMVSKEVLEATSHPQPSNYLYFVAKGDGTHQFSETYQQQLHAIYQYQHEGF